MFTTNDLMKSKVKIKGDVVIYTRPWFSAYYSKLASSIKDKLGCDTSFLSDYSVPGSYDLRSAAIAQSSTGCEKAENAFLKPYMIDIIKRDRLLRSMDRQDAIHRILSYYSAIRDYFSSRNVVCVISATVDQYVIDLIYLYCLKCDIPFLGYHISVLPCYTLFTARGETHPFRNVEEDEIGRAIAVVSDKTFRPGYIPKPGKLKMIGLKRYSKNLARYGCYRILSLLPAYKFNYHVEASLSESRKRLSMDVLRALNWQYEKMPIGNYLYLPLQFHPECNSEYWDRSDSYEDYEDKIIKFAKVNSPHWQIVIKEHPNMLGMRSATFYDALKLSGCSMVHPSLDHRRLLRECFAVVTLNSSAGIEGLCEGKVVVCLSEPYYKSDHHMVKSPSEIIKQSEVEKLNDNFESGNSLRYTVRKILEASVPTTLPDIKYRPEMDYNSYGPVSAGLFAEQIPVVVAAIKSKRISLDECYTITKG